MGITERRERQRAGLRELILGAAARILAEDGFDALTMRKIADDIEYSTATIYLHFANRDEIAMELVRDGFAALLEHLTPAYATPDPLERLKALGRGYIAFAIARPQTYRLIFMENERFARYVMAPLKEGGHPDRGAFEFLTATVQSLLDTGVFRALPAETIAALLFAGLHGIASLKISSPAYPFSGDVAEPAETMIDVLVLGFAHVR